MTARTQSRPLVDLQALGFDSGAHILLKYALNEVALGTSITVDGSAPGWRAQLAAWCQSQGHAMTYENGLVHVWRGGAQSGRWRGAQRVGHSDPTLPDAVVSHAPAYGGLAARGASVEAGAPAFAFRLNDKTQVWADSAADLYAQAVAAQWSAERDIDWENAPVLAAYVEDAIVQIMTYMIENENAALLVPVRFLGQLHPHYRELQAALAMQVADEARHIEVFTRRIRRHGREPALSTVGGQTSLKVLLDEPDFSVASFLLSVLGEGTFVNLLQFLHTEAPDPLTRQIARLAARDEARHVALGMAHLSYRLAHEPDFLYRLEAAVQARHEILHSSAGLNEEVFDALIVVAAGALTPAALAHGAQRVQQLMQAMEHGRRAKLMYLGFTRDRAERLAAMHTRNFM